MPSLVLDGPRLTSRAPRLGTNAICAHSCLPVPESAYVSLSISVYFRRGTVLRPMVPQAPDWDYVLGLLHTLWGDAKDGNPYDREQKRRWMLLLDALEQLARRCERNRPELDADT